MINCEMFAPLSMRFPSSFPRDPRLSVSRREDTVLAWPFAQSEVPKYARAPRPSLSTLDGRTEAAAAAEGALVRTGWGASSCMCVRHR